MMMITSTDSDSCAPTLALRDLERVGAFPRSDETAEAMYLKVVALAESGALQRALDVAHDYFRLFRRSWRSADVLSVASGILAHTGRESEAIAMIEDVLARDPRRSDRARLDTGQRGRYPPRLERVLLRLGRLYAAVGDRASAEAAFALITRPVLGPDDHGESYRVSPYYAVADAEWCRAVVATGDARRGDAESRLRSIAGGDDPAAARLARFALGEDEGVAGERAAACTEFGGPAGFALAARLVASPHASMARIVLDGAARWAYAAPHEVSALLAKVDRAELSARNAATHAVARARVLEAWGRVDEADEALAAAKGERALLARADLAKRHPGEVDADSLAAAAEALGPFVRAIVSRGAAP